MHARPCTEDAVGTQEPIAVRRSDEQTEAKGARAAERDTARDMLLGLLGRALLRVELGDVEGAKEFLVAMARRLEAGE